ncbi:signal peptidase I [Halioxenophilus sp. WMMB6]|uniref:signal peptidase I n=1 Tax=Halioxenophilus sp. WMMB6 TaxID=3073815 RepID=UPI00295F3370|nr:signal peptidase I [Halioxenophilus sp. WMMB6]
MDINFPLILVILVFVSGVIWLFDILVLAKPRKLAIAGVEEQFASEDDKNSSSAYQHAMAAAAREPSAVEYAKSFFPVLFVVLVLRSFLYEPFQIPSESMVPTLEVGDFILVNKFTYGIRLPVLRTKVITINEPKRGDVMVFFPPHKKQYFIKRVVGLPGDTILVDNNSLFINGEKQPQQFAEQVIDGLMSYDVMVETLGGVEHQMRKFSRVARDPEPRTFNVPAGHYFMMGDNRDNSSDSREWGVVPEENIVGKAVAVWMHWDSFFSIPSFKEVGSIQ